MPNPRRGCWQHMGFQHCGCLSGEATCQWIQWTGLCLTILQSPRVTGVYLLVA